MTDEEIEKQAKERAEKLEETQTLGVYDNDEDLARDMGWNDGKVSGYEQGFIDGAKWGTEHEWHDIESYVLPKREISKKYMPKANEKVMLKYHFYNEKEIHYSDGYYDMLDFEFHIPNNPTGRIICVIAWCKLPTYKE